MGDITGVDMTHGLRINVYFMSASKLETRKVTLKKINRRVDTEPQVGKDAGERIGWFERWVEYFSGGAGLTTSKLLRL